MKISPCPFCGSSKVVEYKYECDIRAYSVACNKCITIGPGAKTAAKAIDLWNTRTGTVYNGKTAKEWCKMLIAKLVPIDQDGRDLVEKARAAILKASAPSSAMPPTAPCQPQSEAP